MHLPFHRILRLPVSSRHGIHRNRGLSVLEMIGCLVAIGTGIWLGAHYLEFDLREAWNFGAEKTGLTSFEMMFLPISAASITVVPRPLKGS